MQKTVLESIYRKHHEHKNRYGYLFCGGARLPFLKEWIGSNKKVLDLGCRDGMLTRGFLEGNVVVGADIDRKALEICQKKLGIETVWIDLNREWAWQEEAFDCIVACEVVEHLFFFDEFMANVKRSLKKGGLFIGSVPNAFRFKNRLRFLFGKEYETDPTHVRQFSYEKLQSILGEHFTEIEIIPIEGKMFPFTTVGKHTPKILGKLFGKGLLWKAIK